MALKYTKKGMNLFTPSLTKPNLFFYEKKCNLLLLLHASKIVHITVNASEPKLKNLKTNISIFTFLLLCE